MSRNQRSNRNNAKSDSWTTDTAIAFVESADANAEDMTDQQRQRTARTKRTGAYMYLVGFFSSAAHTADKARVAAAIAAGRAKKHLGRVVVDAIDGIPDLKAMVNA